MDTSHSMDVELSVLQRRIDQMESTRGERGTHRSRDDGNKIRSLERQLDNVEVGAKWGPMCLLRLTKRQEPDTNHAAAKAPAA
jgi:hypothetical protein